MSRFVSPGNIAAKLERKRNKFLALVRRFPGISRQELAKQMRLSTFNISRLAPILIKEGMIIEDKPLNARKTLGRPSLPLRINPDYEYFAGVDLEASNWRFIITDFCGNPVYSHEEPFHPCGTRTEYITQLETLLRNNIESCGKIWEKVSALGVGAPGFINHDTGTIHNYEILPDFTDIPLKKLYADICGKDTFLTFNISNLATFDFWRRPESASMTVLHVAVRSGIASALSIKGKINLGSHFQAGELGQFFVGNGKILQDTTGLSALRKKLPDAPKKFWEGKKTALELEYSKPESRGILDTAMNSLGEVLANAATFIDPDELIVYSVLFEESEVLWKKLSGKFESCQNIIRLSSKLKLRRAPNSHFNAGTGAALYAMEKSYPS